MEQFGPISFVPGPKNGAYPNSHSLYVQGDIKALIDAGAGREQIQALLDGPGVDAVILSHYHEDHIINLNLLEHCQIWMAANEVHALHDLESFLDMYEPLESERQSWRQFMTDTFNYRPRKVHRMFNGRETIDLGGVIMETIPTPGHTIGHTAFFFPEHGVLFLGDYDLTSFGPYYGDKGATIENVIESVNLLRQIPASVWVASHEQGLFLSDPGDAWDRFLAVIDEREGKLLDLLAKPCTMADIIQARIIYKKERQPQEFFDYGERALMSKHLYRLLAQGTIIQDGDTFRRV
jgi:glyoxylase-like metal-dependent hydrolase (beta-lactamase superfamily II)